MLKKFLLVALITASMVVVAMDFPSANNSFAIDLYKNLKDKHENLFFSPFSITSSLAMAYLGAAGETAAQMERVLRLKKGAHEEISRVLAFYTEEPLEIPSCGCYRMIKTSRSYHLSVANAMWVQEGYQLLDEFVEDMKKYYRTSLNYVDFVSARKEAVKKINEWVEERTLGKIKDLLKEDDVDHLTRLVLTNAICFRGEWLYPFDPEATRKEKFHISKHETVDVDMMSCSAEFRYFENEFVQVLEMPYKGDDIAMIVVLPREWVGLDTVEEELDLETIRKWLKGMSLAEVDVQFPKFKLESRFSLKETLVRMGMSDAFSDSADFSKMDGTKNLKIQNVIHKTFVEVEETGTEAAAATAVLIGIKMAPSIPFSFKANRPFLFFIYDRVNDLILFMGRLVRPS